MRKNSFSKKALSLIMAVALIATTLSVGFFGIAASAASVAVSNTDSAVIAVPETVYMTPSTDASTTGQYYVNNTVTSGSYTVELEASAANTNGYVQFYIPGAKDVTVVVNTVTEGIGDIVLAEAGATSGTYEGASLGALIGSDGYFAYNTVGLYITGTGVSAGSTALAEWIFTVTMSDGSVRKYYAYSTLYAPYYYPIGAATRAKAHDCYAQSIAWVSGVHSFTANNDDSKYWVAVTNETFSNESADVTARGTYYAKTSGNAMVPLIYGVGTAADTGAAATDWLSSGAPGGGIDVPTFRYFSLDKGGTSSRSVMVIDISPVANITVDTSRYTNLNQIPNLQVGFNATDVDDAESIYWYASDYTDVAHKHTSANNGTNNFYNWTKRTTKNGILDYEGTWYNGSSTGNIYAGSTSNTASCSTSVEYQTGWNRSVVTGSNSYDYMFKGALHTYGGTHRAYSINYVQLRSTNADKASLRQLVLQGTSLNQNNYTSASWEKYQTQLRAAAQNLGNPSNASVDTSALTDARDALQTTITLNANGGSIGTTSFNQTVGAAATYDYPVSSYTPTRTGYTFNGWSTSSTATSGSTSSVSTGLKPTLYATWEINSYTIKWVYADGTEKSETIEYGKSVTIPANSTKASDATNHYSYSWSPSVATTVTDNATYTEVLTTTAHSWSDWSETSAPNCIETGAKQRNCTSCGYVEDATISALGHTESEAVIENNVDPNCTTEGSYDTVVYCSVCGTEISRVTTTVNALGHTGVIDEGKDATCTETGLTEGKHCEVCGEVLVAQEEIPALGHTAGEVVVENTTDATCTAGGTYDEVVYCTVCGEEVSRETITGEALGHTEVIDEGKDATCTETGLTEGKHCSVCGEVLVAQEEIPALGHTAGEAVVEDTTDATCTAGGAYDEVVYCTVCGEEISRNTVAVDALGHTESEAVIENNVDPNCTTEGSYDTVVYCSVCGAEISRVTTTVNALGHTEVTETIDATCTEDGKVTVKCSVCGEVISEETISAPGHSMGDWEVTTYPTFDTEGVKTKSCANCDYAETETLNPVKLRTTRIISSEIDGNNITITSYTNADTIAFYRTTVAGDDIEFAMWYDEEDLADAPTPIKKGDESPRWIIYQSRWSQYAVDGKYTDKMTIAGVEYNLTVIFKDRELEANDIVLTEKFTNITVDNENKVITLIPPKGTESITMNQTSRQYDEFTYTIDADSYDNVTLNAVSGAYRGSYTISANGEFETEMTVTVNKGKYCQTDYTLKVIFIDFDLVSELKPLRGVASIETYEDGREYIKITMAEGQTSTGIYKTGKGTAITDVSVELANGNMTEKDNLYVGYVTSNKVNPTGTVTISLSNGSVLTYDIVFDMGIVETDVDPLDELKLIRASASFDDDGTLRITRNSGLAQSAGAGFYATTTAGETVTFTTEQGTVYAGRTDAFIAYLTQNTSNVKGKISYTLSDGTVVEYNAVIDLGLGDEYVEPEEPVYDLATDLRAIRGTVSVEESTVTITMAEGKTATGIYNTTTSGATVEITDANGTFAVRDDAYVAYISSNTANVEGAMTVTFADGTTAEYTVIFDLGL